MLIFDAHLDLAMNAVEWNRDLTRSLSELRDRERDDSDKPDRGRGVVSFEEMQRGEIRWCIATQIARYADKAHPLPGWRSPEIAWAITQAQLAWYRTMEEQGYLVSLCNGQDLKRHWQRCQTETNPPIGYVLSLEGADSLVSLGYLEIAYEQGLRAVGPAHYGPGRYAPGTGSEGGLTPLGRELVREMDRLGMVLDMTHLTDEGFFECLELFQGPVWASHNNCRELVPHQRQFSDEQLKELLQRQAVIGVALDAWMLHPGWQRGQTQPATAGVTLQTAVDHIDHICQLAGNASQVGIGSDLDGGFGTEQCPADLNSIADLQKFGTLLADRGYSPEDQQAIMHGNWIRRLREVWSNEP